MATQGQVRAQARTAVRSARRVYRSADSGGEKLQRELDRLIKRKTLVTPEDITKALQLAVQYAQLVGNVIAALKTLAQVLGGSAPVILDAIKAI